MIRRAIRAVLAGVLRIFFRRLEVCGLERLPAGGPAVLVLNHPSALIDPAVVLCALERPVSFLAKEPIFRIPLIGALARALDAIPVWRRQDAGADLANNRRTFEIARGWLASGGLLALFPEGTSHSDPRLRPLKTGAARIALGACAQGLPGGAALSIVPAGLFFTDKGTFRSEALLRFGAPIAVPPSSAVPGGEPDPEAVRALTAAIEKGLGEVTLQADQEHALRLVARAERVFASGEPAREAEREQRLARQFELRRRILDGWTALKDAPGQPVLPLEHRLARYESALELAGLEPEQLDPRAFRLAKLGPLAAKSLLALFALLPAGLVGGLIHYPAYLAVDRLAHRLERGDETMRATLKVLASAVFFPLTWGAVGAIAGLRFGAGAGALGAAAAALSAYAALLFFERLDAFAGGARALGLFLFRRRAFLALAREREAIRARLLELAAQLEASGGRPPPATRDPGAGPL